MAPHKKLRDLATEGNPSQLGDPISLKAETADSRPTDSDRGAGESKAAQNKTDSTKQCNLGRSEQKGPERETQKNNGKKTLREIALEKNDSGNPSQLGDPVSLKAETADSEPTDEDRGAGGDRAGKSKL